MITVFVASEEEKAAYEASACTDYRPKLVVGVPGINRQRRFIEEYYPVGTRVVCFDDDVTSLKMIQRRTLLKLFESCFEIADREGCKLWGFSPTSHTLSLKDEAIVGLRYIIGAAFGFTAGHRIDYPWACAEDFTRSVEHFKRDGRVIRFNGIGINTSYYKTPGGLQTYRTPEIQQHEMEEFVEAYSDLAKLRERTGKPTDCRLKLVTEKRLLRPLDSPDSVSPDSV